MTRFRNNLHQVRLKPNDRNQDNLKMLENKKNLTIPKGQPESVNRRTDNTMAKRKRTKGQTTIYKHYT